MFYDSNGGSGQKRTAQENDIYQKHMDDSFRAKTYSQQVQADKKRDNSLNMLAKNRHSLISDEYV